MIRRWTIGCIEGGARDGGDIFAVTKSEQKVSFKDILNGIEVVERSAYEALLKEADSMAKALGIPLTQNRTRGYPTGSEWENVCIQQAQALSRFEKFMKGLK